MELVIKSICTENKTIRFFINTPEKEKIYNIFIYIIIIIYNYIVIYKNITFSHFHKIIIPTFLIEQITQKEYL